jgi:hypothetical protein
MRWPWSKDRRLERAKTELRELHQKTPEIEAKANRLEKHKKDNQFAARFGLALGGDHR